MKIYIRPATTEDLDAMEEIINQAKAYLAEQGSPQWQNGYGPNREKMAADIANGESYVLIADDKVAGVSALMAGTDPVYTSIKEGTWEEKYPEYLSIHKIAVDQGIRGQGISKLFLQLLITVGRTIGYRDLRIDTHEMNTIMQKVILSVGFNYRGIVTFPIPDGERKSYQILLD